VINLIMLVEKFY